MFQVGSDGSDPLQLDHLDVQSTKEPDCMLGRCHDNSSADPPVPAGCSAGTGFCVTGSAVLLVLFPGPGAGSGS